MNKAHFKKEEPKAIISARIPINLWHLCRQNNLAWNEVVAYGAQMMLADKDLIEYPNCKLTAKIQKYQELLEKKNE